MAKPKLITAVTPTVIAKYAYVNKPDSFQGKEEFKITGLMEDTEENRTWIEAGLDTARGYAKDQKIRLKKVHHVPFIFPEDVDPEDFVVQEGKEHPKYDDDYRDKIIFTSKSQFKPGLIDSALASLPEDVRIMGGDNVRIKFGWNPYDGLGSGISLRLLTVQLISKNTSFSGGVNTDGFEAVDDGYVAAGSDEDEDF